MQASAHRAHKRCFSSVLIMVLLLYCTGVWDVVGGVPDDYDECNWSAGDATLDGSTVYLATSAGQFKLMDTRAPDNTAPPHLIIANRLVPSGGGDANRLVPGGLGMGCAQRWCGGGSLPATLLIWAWAPQHVLFGMAGEDAATALGWDGNRHHARAPLAGRGGHPFACAEGGGDTSYLLVVLCWVYSSTSASYLYVLSCNRPLVLLFALRAVRAVVVFAGR